MRRRMAIVFPGSGSSHEATALTHSPQHNRSPARRRAATPAWLGWLIPAGFCCVAVGLLVSSRGVEIGVAPAAAVNPDNLAVGPRRAAMADPPQIEVEGHAQSCNGCHQIFQPAARGERPPSFHTEIELKHGLNDRCLNCHDGRNREMLTLRDGSTVPFAETPQLCAQCHGTVYRDWQRGTHGKTLGSWVTSSPQQRRLSCNECHDPHSPKFESYVPLPGPNTLRMGDQSAHHGHEPTGKQSPLRRRAMELGVPAAPAAPGVQGHTGPAAQESHP